MPDISLRKYRHPIPSDASSSWQPGTRHSFTLTGTSMLSVSKFFMLNWPITCRITPMMSSATSMFDISLDSAYRDVPDRPVHHNIPVSYECTTGNEELLQQWYK